MKSHKIKTILIISVFLIGIIPIAYANVDNTGTNLVNSDTGLTGPSVNSDTTLTGQSPGTFTLQNPLSNKVTSLAGLVQTFVDVVSYILILFAILALVWTGLQYVLAQGNSERIKELHKQLLWIVIGVAIVIGARLIVDVVINTLKATNVINPSTLQSVQSAASGQ